MSTDSDCLSLKILNMVDAIQMAREKLAQGVPVDEVRARLRALVRKAGMGREERERVHQTIDLVLDQAQKIHSADKRLFN